MAVSVDEALVEQAALDWFRELSYEVKPGPEISPGGEHPERGSFADVVLEGRFRQALARLNPHLAEDALDDAARQVLQLSGPDLVAVNRQFHLWLLRGVPVEVVGAHGERRGDFARLIDFENPENNDWLIVNQFRLIQGERHRKPDLVVFVNGLPLGVIELKNPEDPQATLEKAYQQLQTYKEEFPQLFYYNEVLAVADGTEALHGALTSPWEWFHRWRAIENEDDLREELPPLEVLIHGLFHKPRFLDVVQNFVVFEHLGGAFAKKMAFYHQYYAVNAALEATRRAVQPRADKRIGVIWHTQGSGKTLTMLFYLGKLLQELGNPKVLVLTDRNDLDQQSYESFSLARDLIPPPKQTENTEDLRRLLSGPTGDVVFSTIQKFKPGEEEEHHPLLTDRHDVIVIADEAHRSHYNFVDGYAGYVREALPNAAFLGFTGTPIEVDDRNTRQVFGEYISIYDMEQARQDKAVVPIYYECRTVKVRLTREDLDERFDEITERVEEQFREKLKSKWARLEAIVGDDDRLKKLAQDLLEHFEERIQTLPGKAMVACMSRRICVELYKKIVALKPEWHSDDDQGGAVKVVMTGSPADPLDWQPHIRSKTQNEAIKKRFIDPEDPLKLVIVRDMWLTGFDNPCLHTMYVDKPMRGHTLLQAIARVNRVFPGKDGGLVVDYIGIFDDLEAALAQYTREQREQAVLPLERALDVMKEKYDVVQAFFAEVDYRRRRTLPPTEQVRLLQRAVNAVTQDDETKRHFLKAVAELTSAFALAVPHPEALAIREDLRFFQAVRHNVMKYAVPVARAQELAEVEAAIRQLVAEAITAGEVIDLFEVAGQPTPELSLFNDELLERIRQLDQPNLQVELLRKLLEDEIEVRLRKNVTRYRSFKERLQQAIQAYHSRTIRSAEIVARLVELARELRELPRRHQELGLSEEEAAFYDAVAQGTGRIAGDEELVKLVRELIATIKNNLSMDWADRESSKAKIRAAVKRLLKRKGYKPPQLEAASGAVLEQALQLYRHWIP
jgi:type I restriction enzyme R subunit